MEWAMLGLLLLGRAMSWVLYNATWWNSMPIPALFGGAKAGDEKRSAVMRFLQRGPHYAVFHVVAMTLLTWSRLEVPPLLVLLVAVLALKAVLRFGVAEWDNIFLADRILIVAAVLAFAQSRLLAVAYVAVVATCCLQYIVAFWGLAPPYSNYLGFEYIRYASVYLLVAHACDGALHLAGYGTLPDGMVWTMAIGAMSDYYYHQGAGKLRLGDHLFDWVLHNRGECIMVNSYLRGWKCIPAIVRIFLPSLSEKEAVLAAARVIRAGRLPMGLGAILMECGGVLAIPLSLVTPYALPAWYLAIGGFHVVVMLMTGIVVWENIVVNLFMAVTTFLTPPPQLYVWTVVGFTILISDMLVLINYSLPDSLLKVRMVCFDAADLLMCWFDSPYMRMFMFKVSDDTKTYGFPSPMFSPFDTQVTDIHTRLCYLQLHHGLDLQRTMDLDVAHSGVWGLLMIRDEVRKMYAAMDKKLKSVDEVRGELGSQEMENASWIFDGNDDEVHPAQPLLEFFKGVNNYRAKAWYRWVMQWPHFPGEDWVPDFNPIAYPDLPSYSFPSRTPPPIRTVEIRRIKTFFTGDDILVLEDTSVGVIKVPSGTVERVDTRANATLTDIAEEIKMHRPSR